MGVPKFFRWLSERYPAISQLIAEKNIPEFDCLYLDMNGIIHNCTHKDSDSPTFRMTQHKMFIAIFNYIEHLFGKIKPKKLFFLAIDGVAPRAKMNQQRGRRFRTALDAEVARQRAIQQGVTMPEEEPFDSNCITPGTEFMAKLVEQLKYFINKKVSEDADWQGIEVVLSGPEVPGEGEHKIMEYIRLAKAQPTYDPNVRHCLYGLDADLIMLGLLSHDPHFCLLREEVTFGRSSTKRSKELEHQNFYLMHLSVVREYLEHEFQELKEPGVLNFEFDFERIIDDFILLAFFVGNDFLPNLPNLHINEGALSFMFESYKNALPKAQGYINNHGKIELARLALLLEELEAFEYQTFENEVADANWLKDKQRKGIDETIERNNSKRKLTLTKQQKELFYGIKLYVQKMMDTRVQPSYDLPSTLPARDRKFVEDLANSLHLKVESVLNKESGDRNLRLTPFPSVISDSEDEEESNFAICRILRRYDKALVVDVSPDEAKAEMDRNREEKFREWRDDYYTNKLGFSLYDENEITKLTENYVQGLQWVLYYYYKGVVSWPWYYRYHYSPKITDIRRGLDADLNFKLGRPFRPFEQLMGVLPSRSKMLVAEAYRSLMTDRRSPIIDFYPEDFQLDKNGKKQDWEAVVKIPFIDERRLLTAMKDVEHLLTASERARNSFGSTLKFSYDADLDFEYPSSYEGVFPPIPRCHCVINIFELPTLEGLEIIVGLCDGVKLGVDALAGFPTLKTIPHTAQLEYHAVNIFNMDSRNESMVITLANSFDVSRLGEAKKKIGNRVFVGYPFLQEARVDAVSDELFRYVSVENGQVMDVPHGPREIDMWRAKADKIENHYNKRLGMVIGHVDLVYHVSMLKGLKRTGDGAWIKDYAKLPGVETDYAAQTIVEEVVNEDERFLEKAALHISDEFPDGTRVFFLGDYAYGGPCEVLCSRDDTVDVWVARRKGKEPGLKEIVTAEQCENIYVPAYQVARELGLNPLVLSKITSSFSVMCGDDRVNLGLNLKFEAKKLKVLGYSRKRNNTWEFSTKAITLLQEYMKRFPEFFTGLQMNPTGDIYQDTEFYDPSNAKRKIQEMKEWLKSIESKSFEKVPLDVEQLDASVVRKIEEAVDAMPNEEQPDMRRINKVIRQALLKPADAEHRLGEQTFAIADRVVYVQDSGKVPIGCRGTIIGLTTTARMTMLDVVWDATFMSGTTLNDRCSPFRGMTVPAFSVLNLTNRQVVAHSAASRQHLQNRSQSVPSVPPMADTPPPLRGSYSAAVIGQLPVLQTHHSFVNGRGGPWGGRGSRGPYRGSLLQHNQHNTNGYKNHTNPEHYTNGNDLTPGRASLGFQHLRGGTSIPRRGNDLLSPVGGPPVIMQRNHPPQSNNAPPDAGVHGALNTSQPKTEQFHRLTPRNYQNVPPPPNLNQKPRGRGGFRNRRGGRGGDQLGRELLSCSHA